MTSTAGVRFAASSAGRLNNWKTATAAVQPSGEFRRDLPAVRRRLRCFIFRCSQERVAAGRLRSLPAGLAGIEALLRDMAASVGSDPVPTPVSARHTGGSMVPGQKYRVLGCEGGSCNNAGAALVWGHLRNEQKRLNLRTTGAGMMSAKTSCLGPCNLAPVVQVLPDGTYYGGVDEAGIDRIVGEHIMKGSVVAALAYAPLDFKESHWLSTGHPTGQQCRAHRR